MSEQKAGDGAATPGPWTVVQEDRGEYGLLVTADGSMADICYQISSPANARLIASAPDLLAALEMVRDYVVTMKGGGHEYQVVIDAAIERATK